MSERQPLIPEPIKTLELTSSGIPYDFCRYPNGVVVISYYDDTATETHFPPSQDHPDGFVHYERGDDGLPTSTNSGLMPSQAVAGKNEVA